MNGLNGYQEKSLKIVLVKMIHIPFLLQLFGVLATEETHIYLVKILKN